VDGRGETRYASIPSSPILGIPPSLDCVLVSPKHGKDRIRQKMSAPLPSDTEVVERQASDLLLGLRRKDPPALRRYYAANSLAGAVAPTLAKARYVIAREYGFASWRKLIESLQNRDKSKVPAPGA
jgi:hypothetical protein